MEHPKDIGDRSVLAVMVALREAGYRISIPFGENARYDLVIDDGERLARVQCKSGRLVNGAVVFKTASSYAHHRSAKHVRRHYRGEIDFFGVFCRATGGTFLVPIGDVATTCEAKLRVAPALNGQRRRVRLAAHYEIANVRAELVKSCVEPRPL